jgi:hypothetical protein
MQPCRCSGTAGYIHPQCLEEYIHHYPDGKCRVCLSAMRYTSKINYIALYVLLLVLSALVYLAKSPWILRMILFTSCAVTTTLFVAGPDTAFISCLLLILYASSAGTEYAPLLNTAVITFGGIYTIAIFIPPQYLLAYVTIGICTLYMCLFSVVLATQLDVWTNALLINILGVSWVMWLRYRPLVR